MLLFATYASLVALGVEPRLLDLQSRPWLFKGWIMASTRQITIQWIHVSINKTNHDIQWTVIYLLDSIIRLSNNSYMYQKANHQAMHFCLSPFKKTHGKCASLSCISSSLVKNFSRKVVMNSY